MSLSSLTAIDHMAIDQAQSLMKFMDKFKMATVKSQADLVQVIDEIAVKNRFSWTDLQRLKMSCLRFESNVLKWQLVIQGCKRPMNLLNKVLNCR